MEMNQKPEGQLNYLVSFYPEPFSTPTQQWFWAMLIVVPNFLKYSLTNLQPL